MKRAVLMVAILLQAGQCYSEFTLQTIENKTTDLKFDGAYYKQLGKEKKLPALTDQLQKSNEKQHVVIDKKISSQGVAFVMSDQKGHKATIFIHGQPAHSIEFKRKKTEQIAKFPEITAAGTGSYSAQVMMQDFADSKMVAQPQAYNYQEPAGFNLVVSGGQGSYQLSLYPTFK